MKIRTAALLAAPIAMCLAATSHAAAPAKAPAPLAMTDLAGDANGISTQGQVTGTPVPDGTSTPADVKQFDIKSLTIAATGAMASRKVGKKTVKYFNCTGYTATLELSDAPLLSGTLYRVQAATGAHDQYWLEMSNPAGAATATTLRYTDDATTLGTSSIAITPAKVTGSKITFTVTAANLKASGESIGKTLLAGFGADVRTNGKVNGSGATAPMWDQLTTDGSQTWKVCPQ